MTDLVQYLTDLRSYYPEGRKVHRLLGAIGVTLPNLGRARRGLCMGKRMMRHFNASPDRMKLALG